MGLESIPERQPNQTIFAEHVNLFRSVLKQNFVPRNVSAVVANLAGSLGTESFKWSRAHIATGYFAPGDRKHHYSYNGTVSAGHGWMLCNGRLINKANYDAEHGEGSWDIYIKTSPLENRYLPDDVGKYIVGSATSTHDGLTPFTPTGAENNEMDLSHDHRMEHTHMWTVGKSDSKQYSYNFDGNQEGMSGYVSGGTGILFGTGAASSVSGISGTLAALKAWYTGSPRLLNNSGAAELPSGNGVELPIGNETSTGHALSETENIQPWSNEAQVYMRII